MHIEIQKTAQSRIAELATGLKKFGRVFSDHMFIVDYKNGEWQEPKIIPYGELALSPATSSIHYGQSIFEGMKAFRTDEDEILIFRPYENIKRLNISAERMCMPNIPEEIFYDGLIALLNLDKDWVPEGEDNSLYIRPFMFATDHYIGVKPSEEYRFMIFTTPVGKYYSEPVRVKVETKYTRACDGGVGYTKSAGNYAASLYPAKLAQQEGFHQLIWTDYKEHKYIEESGTMNIMFMIDGILVTPKTSETILKGITRESILILAKEKGVQVEERQVAVDEIVEAITNGTLQEAFGVGTAATISQIEAIHHNGITYELPPVNKRVFSTKIADQLNQIKRGTIDDTHHWIVKI